MSSEAKTHAIVMRVQGMRPRDLVGYEKHHMRGGGDLGQCESSCTPLNRRLIGTEARAQDAWDEIQDMCYENHLLELKPLRPQRRKTEFGPPFFEDLAILDVRRAMVLFVKSY